MQQQAIQTKLVLHPHVSFSSFPQKADILQEVVLLIGLEGGLGEAEITLAKNTHHFQALSLGKRILRMETAALVAPTIVQLR